MRTHIKRLRQKTSNRSLRARSIWIALAASALLAVGVSASSAATSSIEGVWSFNGGQIAIQPEGNGEFKGTVVSPTTIETCVHEVGEKIWSGLTLQADGSYWGSHQWFYAESSCTKNPQLGKSAWRVIAEPNGSRYLRVCLAEPGQPQPTLPPNDTSAHVGQTCRNSALAGALPVAPNEKSGTAANKETLSLPSAKKCLSVRLFQIHLQDPKFDPFKQVVVTLKGKKLVTHRHGKYILATINLTRLPRGAFTIKIRATTVLGHHLAASRTYHTCTKKIVKKKTHKKG
jgi:hypothetical protein